jgi:hypothetical protein
MSLMSFIYKMILVLYRVDKWRYFKYLLTRQQMVFHLFFRIDSVHQIVSSLSHALWVY